MQPKTVTKTKDNLEVARENKKEILPIEQWDHVAFKLIRDILAPDGFKKISTGHHRGSIIAKSKSPGIEKMQVTYCQKGAAQLVRTFRGQAQRAIQDELKKSLELHKQSKAKYLSTPFWRFKERKRWYGLANAHSGYIEAYQEAMGILLQQKVK